MFKSGFVAIIGRTNVGKSTLLNKIIGEKLVITANKPQTTRNQIQCILNGEDHQVIFIDTPGFHKPKSKLGEFMIKTAEAAFSEVDAVLYLVEADEFIGETDQHIIEQLKNTRKPIILCINKIDTIEKPKLFKIIESFKDKLDFAEIIPISATKGEGVKTVVDSIVKLMPEGPKYFPDDMIIDQPEKQIVAEIIREKALHLLQDEVPHGIAVEVNSMKDRKGKDITDIQATIYCERDSHKGIIIGKQGKMLKSIGQNARYEIERFLGTQIFLEIWVKVKEDWRNSESMLKNLGYK